MFQSNLWLLLFLVIMFSPHHHDGQYDCVLCLKQSLYNTVPGLQNYGQPNTRAMTANSVLRERRYSVAIVPAADDGGSSDGAHHTQAARTDSSSNRHRDKKHGAKSPDSDDWESMLSVTGSSNSRSPRRADGTPRKGSPRVMRPFLRPRTAGALMRSQAAARPTAKSRPTTSFLHRKFRPKFGKSAYSERDRSMQEMVLNKFNVIFSPERKVHPSTAATPLVLEDDLQSESSGSSNQQHDAGGVVNGQQRETITVGGEDFEVDRKPRAHQRVIWSARPHTSAGHTFIPNGTCLDSSSSDCPSDCSSASSRFKSSSMTMLSRAQRPKSDTSFVRDCTRRPPTPCEILDPKIQALALQRSFSSLSHQTKSVSEKQPLAEPDERGQGLIDCPAAQTQPKQNGEQKTKLPVGQVHAAISCESGNANHSHRSPSAQGHYHNHPSHHHGHVQAQLRHGTFAQSSSSPRAMARRRSVLRPSLTSEANGGGELTPPSHLLAKLMKAEDNPGAAPPNNRSAAAPPTTAPVKSELTHRFIPVSRKTVVGILAQIENQRASTRTMLNESRDLQEVVKKLVPWEQQAAEDSDEM